MATWAKVDKASQRVIGLYDSATQPVDAAYSWVDISKLATKPQTGWSYDGVAFSDCAAKPLPLTPRQQALALLKTINKEELVKTDTGKALLALLYLQGIEF